MQIFKIAFALPKSGLEKPSISSSVQNVSPQRADGERRAGTPCVHICATRGFSEMPRLQHPLRL